MEAANLPVGVFLSDIRVGRIRLPRFQRREVWTHQHIDKFLTALISRESPTGVLLFLEVGQGKEKFETRPIEGADKGSEDCKKQLLDGQQRLTAIYRALEDNYEDRAYYVRFESDSGGGYRIPDYHSKDGIVASFSKGSKDRKWMNDSKKEFEKNLMPIRLLHPESGSKAANIWVNDQGFSDGESIIYLTEFITKIRDELLAEQLPYLTLKEGTSLDVAIDVFMKINTSFVKLSAFDIAVALFESGAQKSLQSHVNQLTGEVPQLARLEGESGVGDLALKISCLFQGKKPTYGNYRELDMKKVDQEWGELTDGLKWTARVLNELKIWDQKRLPSAVPIRVLAALHQSMQVKKGDDYANAMRLIKQYLWRSFTTDWYSRQANDRLFEDYKVLKQALEDGKYKINSRNGPNTVFNCALPSKGDLLDEGWPTARGILKKAILAISFQRGAYDVASDEPISASNIGERQYHHIFPENLFEKHFNSFGTKLSNDPQRALNCMLIDEFTNKSWKDKWPGNYLQERDITEDSPKATLIRRLKSHHLPEDLLLDATEDCGRGLGEVYEEFLNKRAEMTLASIKKLCKDGTLD